VGAHGTIVGSSDGVTWTPAPSPTGADLMQVIFTGDRFVAVGGDWNSGAATITSSDGQSWAELASPPGHMFHAVVRAGDHSIAAANSRSDLQIPAQFHSIAGGGWTMRQGPDFYEGVEAAGLLVVAGLSLAVSTDGGASWETTLPASTGARGVAFSGPTFVVA